MAGIATGGGIPCCKRDEVAHFDELKLLDQLDTKLNSYKDKQVNQPFISDSTPVSPKQGPHEGLIMAIGPETATHRSF